MGNTSVDNINVLGVHISTILKTLTHSLLDIHKK
jgi:hypothetical protein